VISWLRIYSWACLRLQNPKLLRILSSLSIICESLWECDYLWKRERNRFNFLCVRIYMGRTVFFRWRKLYFYWIGSGSFIKNRNMYLHLKNIELLRDFRTRQERKRTGVKLLLFTPVRSELKLHFLQ
jgi:hypothetical protein